LHNYYHILGLRHGASLAEIKSAYRKLAFKYHPDHNHAPDARERFLVITEAYNYLLDPPASRPAKSTSNESASRADAERVKRAQDAAKHAAQVKFAAFKRKLKEEQDTKHYTLVFNLFVATMLLVGAIFFGKDLALKLYVNSEKGETLGVLQMKIENRREYYRVVYEVNGHSYTNEIAPRNVKEGFLRANDMPATAGSEFVVYYRKDSPGWSYVDYSSISSKTLNMYINDLRTKMGLLYNLPSDDIRIDCLCIQTFNNFGVDGLANLLFYDVPFLQNMSNNSHHFKTMQETDRYERILRDCLIVPKSQ
jgi:hypothetical protein